MDALQDHLAGLNVTSTGSESCVGYVPAKVVRCANIVQGKDGEDENCPEDGTHSCAGCHLVMYCSRECQTSHRRLHKLDCNADLGKASWQPSWIREKRVPTFMGDSGPILEFFGGLTYLWGNIPAFDVLNIDKNEGKGYAKDLDLCFAASGDLRNMMCSVNGLPERYDNTCNIVINDKQLVIAARNAAMLLIAAQLPPLDAAELIVHLWYSARLTKRMETTLKKHVAQPVAEVVAKIKGKADGVVQSKRWTYGTAEVNVRLDKQQWTSFLRILEAHHEVNMTEQQRKRVVLAPTRVDYRDRELYTLSGARRMCSTKFRETGVLVPFGASLDHFVCSNPLLFNESTSSWLQKDSASPIEGWSIQALSSASNLRRTAKDDLNGLLYFYIRDVIERFCHRVQDPNSKTQLTLYCMDAAILPKVLQAQTAFDRIEVSNIVDDNYLGLHKTLATFALLLKEPRINPHAVLITLFLNACELTERMVGLDTDKAEQKKLTEKVIQYTHLTPKDMMTAMTQPASPETFKFLVSRNLVRDYDKIFAHHMNRVNFELAGRNSGLKMRQLNKVIDPWPMRLKKLPGEPGAEEEFNRLVASPCSGAERYVEWVRES